jgi:ubiquinone/menaquinone biosynthesis C-methylase UbiE
LKVPETAEARFDDVAAAYARHVAPLFLAPASDLVELAELRPGERLLDAGCGPGVAALLAAPKVGPAGAVVGVDASEAMLAIARQKAEQEGLAASFVKGDVEALDLPDASFDVVVSNFGLGTTDPARALQSLRRVLKPGGRLALTHWGPSSRPAQAFYALLGKRRVADPDSRLAWLRETDLTARPWMTEIRTPAALAALLSEHGFSGAQASARDYDFAFADSEAYLEMSLAFPLARAEFDALSPGNQRMFRHELNAALAPMRGPNRSIASRDAILFGVAYS